jgi:starch phosphorylase
LLAQRLADVPPGEVPIRHITNGIHVRTWLSPDLGYTLDRYLPGEWITDPADSSVWEGVMQIPEEELWRAHERGRARLVAGRADAARAARAPRRRLRRRRRRRAGARPRGPHDRLRPPLRDLQARQPAAARRRPAPRMLDDTKRPIQFVFAGKAHPADHEGKELIKAIVNFARDPAVRRRSCSSRTTT